MKKTILSVIVPSRERAEVLKFSLNSLGLERNNLEALVWVDEDDPQLDKYHELFDNNPHIKLFVKPRVGYTKFHEMQTFLVSQACGDWFYLWNDDAYMESVDWYDKFVEYASLSSPKREPVVYNLWGQGSYHNLFPILSTKYFKLLGHAAMHCIADLYIKSVASLTHIHRNIFGIKPLHRKSGADNNKLGDLIDNTYHYVTSINISHFGAYSREVSKAKHEDASKIIVWMRNTKDCSIRVGFVGLGKLGLPVALAIELRGKNIVGYDKNPQVNLSISKYKNHPPDQGLGYRRQGIDYLFKGHTIEIVDSASEVVKKSNLVICSVKSPELIEAVKDIVQAANKLNRKTTVVIISNLETGTYEKTIEPLLSPKINYLYNPLSVRDGTIIRDFLYPKRVLIGVNKDSNVTPLSNLYKMILGEDKISITDIKSAEDN